MNIEKALNRLNWRLTNEKFTPNQNDKEAIEFLNNWVKQQKTQELQNNLLLGKILVRSVLIELVYWQDISQTTKTIAKELELPITHYYEKIKETLNSQELEAFCKNIGMNRNHPQLRTPEQEEQNTELIKTNKIEFEKHVKGVWSDTEVYGGLNNFVTEIINKYKNKP